MRRSIPKRKKMPRTVTTAVAAVKVLMSVL
jgi:hypothetical protein